MLLSSTWKSLKRILAMVERVYHDRHGREPAGAREIGVARNLAGGGQDGDGGRGADLSLTERIPHLHGKIGRGVKGWFRG